MHHASRLMTALLFGWLSGSAAYADPSPWVLVESRSQTLKVLQGDKVVDEFDDIALGRGGAAPLRQRGDNRTPLGEFHIAWINRESPFHIFFGLDFPTLQHADRAYRQKLIDRDAYFSILDALRRQRLPPQNTPLGGRIGIHGLGHGDPEIHRDFNWTQGCVALTNRQIERLAHWVRVGTRVVIR